ncbi:MAG TPA: alpha/beta hydrolase [Candidatus Sulfotelmatobacter sp.]|nr:alpha/beta hydrolase [Candidatus Sulfotelmatobacter sp.]
MPLIQSRDGVSIHCELHGNGPLNLIFLHGWGGDSATWSGVIDHLDKERCRAISIDLRGHGKSGVPDTAYSIRDFSEDVLAVADHFGAKTFVSVGFSSGGKLACYLAAKYPDRVAGLVLVAPAGPGLAPIDREYGLQACREAGDWRKNELIFRNWFAPPPNDEMVKSYCQAIARTPLRVLVATAELFLWTSLASDIGKLKQPALLAIGAQDPVYGMAYQEKEMLPFLDSAMTATATMRSGHFIPLERPAELAHRIDGAKFCL